jgi:hypothetical protein
VLLPAAGVAVGDAAACAAGAGCAVASRMPQFSQNAAPGRLSVPHFEQFIVRRHLISVAHWLNQVAAMALNVLEALSRISLTAS